jgi:hypothetical protein
MASSTSLASPRSSAREPVRLDELPADALQRILSRPRVEHRDRE